MSDQSPWDEFVAKPPRRLRAATPARAESSPWDEFVAPRPSPGASIPVGMPAAPLSVAEVMAQHHPPRLRSDTIPDAPDALPVAPELVAAFTDTVRRSTPGFVQPGPTVGAEAALRAAETVTPERELPVGEAVRNALVRGTTQIARAVSGGAEMLPDAFSMVETTPEEKRRLFADTRGAIDHGAAAFPASESVEEGQAFQPGNPRWWLERGLEQGPQMLLSIGTAVATGGIGGFVLPTFVQEAGDSYLSTRDHLVRQGMDPDAADRLATGTAVVAGAGNAALEAIPGSVILLKKIPGLDRVFSHAVAQRIEALAATAAGRLVAGGTAEGVTEAGQEAWADVMEYAATKDPATFADWRARYAGAGALGAAVGGAADVALGHGPVLHPEEAAAAVPAAPAPTELVTPAPVVAEPAALPDPGQLAEAARSQGHAQAVDAVTPLVQQAQKEAHAARAELEAERSRTDEVLKVATAVAETAAAPPPPPALKTESGADYSENIPEAAQPLEPERVTAAAVRTKEGRVFSGAVHHLAREAAEEAGALAGYQPGEHRGEDGFLTSRGRFVDRAEALRVAKESGQPNVTTQLAERDGGLDALDIRDRFNTAEAEVATREAAAEPSAKRNLFGEEVAPTVEQAGMFTDRDLAPAEKAAAERVSGRKMTAEEVTAQTRAAREEGDAPAVKDTATGELLDTAPRAGRPAVDDFLAGLENPAPARSPAAAVRTPEDPDYQFMPPDRRKSLYSAELAKARNLTDARLLNAYKAKLRSSIRTDADAAGAGHSFSRANQQAAEARQLAYEHVMEARGLEPPTVFDAWRDIPATEIAQRPTLFSTLEEADGMLDGELLDALELAQERYTSSPTSRVLAERVYALGGVAKDRGLIGGSMMPEQIGALYTAPGAPPRASESELAEFVPDETGASVDLARLSPEQSAATGVPEVPIRFPRAVRDADYNAARLEDVRRHGYDSNEAYVRDVARSFNTIYRAEPSGRLLLVKEDGKGEGMVVELRRKNGHLRVFSWGPKKARYLRKLREDGKLLWEDRGRTSSPASDQAGSQATPPPSLDRPEEGVNRSLGPQQREPNLATPAPESQTSEAGGAGGGAPHATATRLPEGQEAGPPAVPGARRIPVAPLPGGEPKRLSSIILDLARGVDGSVRKARTPRGAGGIYYPGSSRTVIRYAGDLDTTAHEVAHALDDRYGIVGQWAGNRQRSPFDGELIPTFSQHGSETKSGPRAKLSYRRAEGVAEWVRAWIVNPAAAEAAAPKFHAHFLKTVPAEVRTKLEAFSRDVRQFAGLDPHERTKANIQMEPEEPSLLEEIQAAFRRDGYAFRTTKLDEWDARLRDAIAPVMLGVDAAKEIGGVDEIAPSHDPAILMRLFGGVDDKFNDVLEHGPITAEGERVSGTGGVQWLLEGLDTSSEESLAGEMADVAAMMVNQRILEKAEQIDEEVEGKIGALRELVKEKKLSTAKYLRQVERLNTAAAHRKARLSGAGAGLFADDQQAAAALKTVKGWDPERRARIEEAAKRYRLWSDAVLRYMVDKGRMSDTQYQQIVASNRYYVAMHRVASEIDPEAFPSQRRGSGKLGAKADPVKRFTGSTKEIGNPYVNLLRQTAVMMREADRNEALRSLTELLAPKPARGMYEGPVIPFDAIGSRAQAGDTNAIPVYVDGREERWQFERGIHAALKGWGNEYRVPPLLTYPGLTMRYFVTHSPDFLARNVVRDASHRAMVSRTGGKPWDVLKGFTQDELSEFRRAGGGQAGHFRQERRAWQKELGRRMKELSEDRNTILVLPGKMLRAWENFAQASELVGRMAEYRRALEHAKTELGYGDYDARLYAAYEARDLIDYAVAGTWIRTVNQVIPFTNPAVQGFFRVLKAAREDPKRLALAWSIYALAPTVAVYALNMALSDDDGEEYRAQPDYIRDLFWSFKLGPDTWLRIPKSFELGVLASGVERAIDRMAGNKDAFEGYFGSVAKSFLPVDETALLGPFRVLIEMKGNRDWFRQRQIIPAFDEGKAVELRKGTEYASRLSKAFEMILPGEQDPRMIDYFIRGQFAGTGKLATSLSDIGRGGVGRDLADLGMTMSGVLIHSPGPAAKDVEYVLARAKYLGLSQDPAIRQLQDLRSAVFEAKTATERDHAAAALRRKAAQLRIHYRRKKVVDGKVRQSD